MNREDAAQKLGISVRSLQRAVQRGALQVKYKRGASGKMEAVFDPDEIARHKGEMEREIVPEPKAATAETALARIDTPTFLTALQRFIAGVDSQNIPPSTRTSAPIESKPLLKLNEASALTGLSRGILREAIDAGRLKAKIVGRAWRVKRADLDLYIKKL